MGFSPPPPTKSEDTASTGFHPFSFSHHLHRHSSHSTPKISAVNAAASAAPPVLSSSPTSPAATTGADIAASPTSLTADLMSSDPYASISSSATTPDQSTSVPAPATPNPATSREMAMREVKQFLHVAVQDDWPYDPTTSVPHWEVPPTGLASATGTAVRCALTSEQGERVTGWREREYDSITDDEDSDGNYNYNERDGDESSAELSSIMAEPRTNRDPFVLLSELSLRPGESPVASEHRLCRRRREQDEMAWNDGLCIWHERRDAWTGAKTLRRPRPPPRSSATAAVASATATAAAAPSPTEASVMAPVVATTVPEPESMQDQQRLATVPLADVVHLMTSGVDGAHLRRRSGQSAEDAVLTPSASTTATSPTGTHPSSSIAARSDDTSLTTGEHNYEQKNQRRRSSAAAAAAAPPQTYDDLTVVPFMRSLIPASNPIVASIRPALYPSIFSKVVIQSLTPAVPINLADMTAAIVQGWKASGEWPAPPPVPASAYAHQPQIQQQQQQQHGWGPFLSTSPVFAIKQRQRLHHQQRQAQQQQQLYQQQQQRQHLQQQQSPEPSSQHQQPQSPTHQQAPDAPSAASPSRHKRLSGSNMADAVRKMLGHRFHGHGLGHSGGNGNSYGFGHGRSSSGSGSLSSNTAGAGPGVGMEIGPNGDEHGNVNGGTVSPPRSVPGSPAK